MIDPFLLLETAEFRGWMLLIGSVSAIIISTMVIAAWGRCGDRTLIPLAMVFAGWAASSIYFSWWNFIGRIDLPHHLMIPNLSTFLMIVGGWSFVRTLFWPGKTRDHDR